MENKNFFKKDINFRKIDKTNYNECIALKVDKKQERFVASNSTSLVQAAYEDNLYPLGIYLADKMVGFILYDYDEDIKGWSFSRFMIAKEYQNKGLGTKALKKFIEFFHTKYPCEKLYTSAEVDNIIAISIYEKYGFVKQNVFEYEINEEKFMEFRMVKIFEN